jgi:2-hydroxychromene-2-carboxylate isomerase
MTAPLEFYFDFSSPYGYLASERIDALAARFGRKVRWRPILLGVLLRETGGTPPTQVPAKRSYFLCDFARSARFMDIPYAQPQPFPVATQHAARAYYWLLDQDHALARRFAHAVFRAYFVDGQDISTSECVLALAAQAGAEPAALAAALLEPVLKERLKTECATALVKGVFGSPHIIIDGEHFFGADRLPQIERWLASGGF